MKYKNALLSILTCFASSLLAAQEPDSLITELLSASVITEGNISYKVDKTTHYFTSAQIQTARDARELVSTVPSLRIDRQSNTLATLSGKRILILLNGVKATDTDLLLIPAGKIRKVDYYDVPPVRYMDMADVVLNVITSRLDTGWGANAYARVGQMYSHGNVAVNRVSGNNQFTFNLSTHINQKRKVSNEETGSFSYEIGADEYVYEYFQKQRDWGNQHSAGLVWLNSRDNDYVLRVAADYSHSRDLMDRTRSIEFMLNDLKGYRTGVATNDIIASRPSVNAYYEKALSESSFLAFDVTATSYSNVQKAFTSETGSYEDMLNLDTDKNSIIGEILYSYAKGNNIFNAGYKGTFSFLRSDLEGGGVSNLKTGRNRIYGEFGSQSGAFSYRVSLGAENNAKAGMDGFSRFSFIPTAILSYRVNTRNRLRLKLDSETIMPEIQQMTDNRILIMENFYRKGNVDVHNSTGYRSSLVYSYNIPRVLVIQADMHYNYTNGYMFNSFIRENNAWYLETRNADSFSETGFNIAITYVPWPWFLIGVDASAERQTIRDKSIQGGFCHWYFPIYLDLSATWGNWNLSYHQAIGGQMLTGLYLEGLEKVSYLSLSYNWNAWRFGLQCLFPFMEDKYSNKTVTPAPVLHLTETNLMVKNHEVGFTVSWSFQSGRNKHANKNIDNADSDSGVFKF